MKQKLSAFRRWMAAAQAGKSMPNEKKRHHYIPVSYLKEFCGPSGRLFAYRKDDPDVPLHVRPEEIGFERYYYSQPLPDNKQDNNRIEDFFSTIETHWPEVVEGFRRREPSTHNSLMAFFEFLGCMRVRVPAARDMIELMLAESVKATTRQIDRRGELPPLPPELASIDLWNNLEVSIDPHKSIHAMVQMTKGFSKLVDRLGFGVIQNKTGHTLITSDNPVAYFDPAVSEDLLKPYDVHPFSGRIELLFPIAPDLLVVGRTEWKFQFSASGIQYYDLFDKQELKRINRYISRFGYRFVFSNENKHTALIRKFAATSPALRTYTVNSDEGERLIFQSVFGPRQRKPKWVRPENQKFESE